MKKTFTILSCILMAGVASAQITITNAIGYQVGDAYTIQPCVPVPNAGSAGANVTVNLATLTDDGSETSASFISASSTGHSSSFPGANLASPASSTGGNEGYAYYNSASSKVELMGIYTSAYTMVYSNPMTMLTFPMSYLDSTYDAFKASYSMNGATVRRSGYVITEADAWGTITTPAGTFPYLRYDIKQVITDSIDMQGQTLVMLSETYTINYMGDNSQSPLYSFNEVYSDGVLAQMYASYAKNIFPTGTPTVNDVFEASSVYPNPATTEANIQFTLKQANTVAVSVVDINGKEVYTYQSNELNAGAHRVNIETNGLAKGIYSAIIKADGVQQLVKFSVQ